MRLVAFKDVVIATENVFDIVLGPREYAIAMARDDPPTADHGPIEAFTDRHPDFAGLFWAREAFCLPGVIGGSARVYDLGTDLWIETVLSSGARVGWEADRATLEVHRGIIEAPDGRVYLLEYQDYRLDNGLLVPGRVLFQDPGQSISIEARVDAVEVNPTLAETWFDPASVAEP